MADKYFDLHFHPAFKQFIAKYEDNYPSERSQEALWQDIRPNNDLVNFVDLHMLHLLGSQCSLTQITAGNELLGVANVVALEYGLADGKNLVGDFLRAKIAGPLDVSYFNKVMAGEISYFHLFIKELNLYAVLANTGSGKQAGNTAKINLLTRKHNTMDLENISIPTFALAIEGGHNLNRHLIHTIPLKESPKAGNADQIYADFSDNAGTMLSPSQSLTHLFKAMWAEDMDLIYLTLTHLTYIEEQSLATHAFGMKLLKNDLFYPVGNGLTAEGKNVIDRAYGMTIDGMKTPVLIDVKHMSLKSRLEFYDYHAANHAQYPILSTHTGVTGYKVAEWINRSEKVSKDANKAAEILTAVRTIAMENSADELSATNYHFNPWTINLMDEDIVAILKSKGMIGISLDRRIIGYEDNTRGNDVNNDLSDPINQVLDNAEYLPQDEYRYFFEEKPEGLFDEDAIIEHLDRNEDSDVDLKIDPQDPEILKRREIVNFALTILHIVAVGNDSDAVTVDPWKHIVIGSDYDGLIDPLSKSEDCSDLSEIESQLSSILKTAAPSYLYYNSYKYPSPILDDIDDGGLEKKVRDIMYNNGARFIKKWYQNALVPTMAADAQP